MFPLNESLTVTGKEASKEEAESASNVAGEHVAHTALSLAW